MCPSKARPAGVSAFSSETPSQQAR
jgi:hypothetical protein